MIRQHHLKNFIVVVRDLAAVITITAVASLAIFWVAHFSLQPTRNLFKGDYGDLEGYSGIANVAVTVISVGIAYFLFVQSEQSRKLNRKADVIISCIERYETLSTFEAQYDPPNPDRARHYFSQYFALKSDQVDFYLAGWIDTDTFITWMRSMLRSWINDRRYYGAPLGVGWRQNRRFHLAANRQFFDLMKGMTTIVVQAGKIRTPEARDAYVDRAFKLLMIEFYDRTRDTRRLLATDFTPQRYFSVSEKTEIVGSALKLRLRQA